jgi:alkanesulfonate monooxygenase SsuD/methylene tetrahydromethanopterin reductase-like flavin-dependent oxidoreductase (luciferase family)
MDVRVGLPNSISGTEGRLLVEWAQRAEALGFSMLATIGRVAYPTYEELVALAATAGATEQIGLMTNVLLAPTRDPVLLAKETASLDQLSGGRLTLGLRSVIGWTTSPRHSASSATAGSGSTRSWS